jgi:hypothetical protein
MNSKLSAFIVGGLLLTSCGSKPTGGGPSITDGSIPSDPPSKTEESTETTSESTTVEVAYIALEDNGANGPLVGCGDSEILTEETLSGKLNTKDRIEAALENLFANKDQFLGGSGLYNALYQSTLVVNSVKIEETVLTVEISGETQSGGECDDPRIMQQIRATVENNIDSEKKLTITILLNDKPLEKLQDLSGE